MAKNKTKLHEARKTITTNARITISKGYGKQTENNAKTNIKMQRKQKVQRPRKTYSK